MMVIISPILEVILFGELVGGSCDKMLSAYQARRMMPDENATKLVEYILSGAPGRAKNGYYDITVGCPDDTYTEHDIEVAEAQLKKLGYNINHGYGPNSIWFFMNWRESQNFSKNPIS